MTPMDPMLPTPWIVRQVMKEARDTFTLTLEPSDGTLARFRPGQFSMLWVFGVGEAPISISGDPSDDGHLVYTVRSVGQVTQAVVNRSPGEWLAWDGAGYGGEREWRGVGEIPASGLRLTPRYRRFDAEHHFAVNVLGAKEPEECIAGLVLQGLRKPWECPAFRTRCTPERPLGAPMVSSEGACAAYYRYGKPDLRGAGAGR